MRSRESFCFCFCFFKMGETITCLCTDGKDPVERENTCDSIENEENSGRNDYSCIDVRGWICCMGGFIDLPKSIKSSFLTATGKLTIWYRC